MSVAGPVLAIDPGRRTGLALVWGVELLSSCTAPDDAAVARAVAMAAPYVGSGLRCVVEVPQILSSRRDVAADDIVLLAFLAGRIAGAVQSYGELLAVRPGQWKGSIPKPVHHARVRAKIPSGWYARWDEADHNGRDAIALAVWRRDVP